MSKAASPAAGRTVAHARRACASLIVFVLNIGSGLLFLNCEELPCIYVKLGGRADLIQLTKHISIDETAMTIESRSFVPNGLILNRSDLGTWERHDMCSLRVDRPSHGPFIRDLRGINFRIECERVGGSLLQTPADLSGNEYGRRVAGVNQGAGKCYIRIGTKAIQSPLLNRHIGTIRYPQALISDFDTPPRSSRSISRVSGSGPHIVDLPGREKNLQAPNNCTNHNEPKCEVADSSLNRVRFPLYIYIVVGWGALGLVWAGGWLWAEGRWRVLGTLLSFLGFGLLLADFGHAAFGSLTAFWCAAPWHW